MEAWNVLRVPTMLTQPVLANGADFVHPTTSAPESKQSRPTPTAATNEPSHISTVIHRVGSVSSISTTMDPPDHIGFDGSGAGTGTSGGGSGRISGGGTVLMSGGFGSMTSGGRGTSGNALVLTLLLRGLNETPWRAESFPQPDGLVLGIPLRFTEDLTPDVHAFKMPGKVGSPLFEQYIAHQTGPCEGQVPNNDVALPRAAPLTRGRPTRDGHFRPSDRARA